MNTVLIENEIFRYHYWTVYLPVKYVDEIYNSCYVMFFCYSWALISRRTPTPIPTFFGLSLNPEFGHETLYVVQKF